ncbi:sensor histidine kinase [Dyadobacter sp. CY312]|uniref:sensor histidine kinase n=1 Tax=Dyadobacter sp. CY312 TaxID=2907303 RepID=UPI001F3A75D0|nr:histidine kinase [Dyadobacter sp. CY312]MCE7041551.1 histidine kinase [Dyadobacter sp. CY312]
MTKSIALLLIFVSVSLTHLQAQEIVLNEQTNRFLINQQSNKPRLDVIVQSFTDYERDVISKSAVMDTVTKPTFERVSDSEYNVTASRMGEAMTFVIRNYKQSETFYITRYPTNEWSDTTTLKPDIQFTKNLNGERAIVLANFPFLARKAGIKLLDDQKNVVFQLNITFSYPKPELIYVDITAGYGNRSWEDTSQIRKIVNRVNKVPTVYSQNNAVPDQIVTNNDNLYFRFKKAYYDGEVSPTEIFCKIDDHFIARTPSELYPSTDVHTLAHEDDWYILPSGEHTIFASYDGKNTMTYKFEMNKMWGKVAIFYLTQFSYLIIAVLYTYPWILVIVLGLVLFANWGNRLKKAREEARKVNLELQSIQSQLNPHFVFNALGSIQGLINQNEIERANSYLTDFSKLLRKSLNNNGKEMVPLSEELYVLDSYIKLERLRFDFIYNLLVDEKLQVTQVEIPSLLIQPLIENAIKHGISGLGNDGVLNLSFLREQSDLIIKIEDNGSGFDASEKKSGKGLELTRERIKLLNRQKHKISMDLRSGVGKGTLITLIFKHFC